MTRSTFAKAALVAVLASPGVAAPMPAAAFWQRSQVSLCADATTAQELARHRCDELRAYADPGWPALGLGQAGYGAYRTYRSGPAQAPPARPPVRRLG